ncbi:protein GPR107 [Ischnura elegans]|uniref:protein GPR107 n=1 Tax=Ischnura elegans TaxID=197161 RepID=UPI001ED88621|nr:protein GPR107 [Ischnura elegans]
MFQRKSLVISLFLCIFYSVNCRIHKLEVQNDVRKYIALSTFGFYEGGLLNVKLINFHASPFTDTAVYGFSLDRTVSDAMNPYLDSHQESCLLQEPIEQNNNGAVIYFTMDFKNKVLQVKCSRDLQMSHIYRDASYIPVLRAKRDSVVSQLSDTSLFHQRRKRDVDRPARTPPNGSHGNCAFMPLPITVEQRGSEYYYNTSFVMYVAAKEEEGLYNLYFHSCPNYGSEEVNLDFLIEIEEKNSGNYLSAGEMPLPALYFMMAILFFLSGCFWVFILRKSKNQVFKIHYLMGVLVYLKSFSLLFHGINFHFIQTNGEHVAAWAVLYYVTHLCKGAVLFITIVLIGTGWTFIKYILSEKDKKIFMIVIPLQVLANVAEIIIEESEEGDLEYRRWRDIFILVDLICCGAILFPVVWSIRHLQEASQTDGKAAINLRKLKLFRHFYIMIVCYIYFTRIIVYLLRITVPFQYEWLDAMFREMATYVFFVLTGYKFRPASANPYFQLNQDDEDDEEEEMDIVVTQTGLTEGLTKISRTKNSSQTPEEDKEILLSKRESSHEYD